MRNVLLHSSRIDLPSAPASSSSPNTFNIPAHVLAGDFDADGVQELLLMDVHGRIRVLKDGRFYSDASPVDSEPHTVTALDTYKLYGRQTDNVIMVSSNGNLRMVSIHIDSTTETLMHAVLTSIELIFLVGCGTLKCFSSTSKSVVLAVGGNDKIKVLRYDIDTNAISFVGSISVYFSVNSIDTINDKYILAAGVTGNISLFEVENAEFSAVSEIFISGSLPLPDREPGPATLTRAVSSENIFSVAWLDGRIAICRIVDVDSVLTCTTDIDDCSIENLDCDDEEPGFILTESKIFVKTNQCLSWIVLQVVLTPDTLIFIRPLKLNEDRTLAFVACSWNGKGYIIFERTGSEGTKLGCMKFFSKLTNSCVSGILAFETIESEPSTSSFLGSITAYGTDTLDKSVVDFDVPKVNDPLPERHHDIENRSSVNLVFLTMSGEMFYLPKVVEQISDFIITTKI